jgi:predicted nucleic acid-binding protein
VSATKSSAGEAVLLDTNVLSELLRARPDAAVLGWFAEQAQDQLFVSAITQAEMLLGALLLPAGKRRVQLQQAVAAPFRDDFAGRVLPFDAAAAAAYAPVVAARRRAGRPISQFDAQIAAIATSRPAALATRNTADSEGCGVDLHNPWRQVG